MVDKKWNSHSAKNVYPRRCDVLLSRRKQSDRWEDPYDDNDAAERRKRWSSSEHTPLNTDGHFPHATLVATSSNMSDPASAVRISVVSGGGDSWSTQLSNFIPGWRETRSTSGTLKVALQRTDIRHFSTESAVVDFRLPLTSFKVDLSALRAVVVCVAVAVRKCRHICDLQIENEAPVFSGPYSDVIIT